MSETNKIITYLEDYHAEELKPIVDKVAKRLVDKNNFVKILNKNTPRGMGYDSHNIGELSNILQPKDYSVYKVFCTSKIDLYTGEGILSNRIARFLKAVNGENRYDETHAADELFVWIKEGKIDKEKLLNNLYYSSVNIFKDVADEYKKLSLEKYSSISDDTVYAKYEIDRLVKLKHIEHKFKPIGIYIEKKVMQRYGSLLNKNNMNMLNDERYNNYHRLVKTIGL
jgi:hypothetical protein|tara:strand:+ start:51 stop:728 length:678 start_codon:yes stop_codon:yes gene_type:complete